MRKFSHLTKHQIREIHVGYLSGVPKLAIARDLQIDNSTVHYHINKIKHMPPQQVVALVLPTCGKCAAGHTSLKCLVCGTASDNIKSEEFQTIKRQREEITRLKAQLLIYEKNHPSSPTSPITTILG